MEDVKPLGAILLATDFSERSADAEAMAVSLAEMSQGVLYLVNAIEPIIGVEPGDEDAAEFEEFYKRLMARADEEAERRIEQWKAKNLVVKYHVEIGPRWKVVVKEAEKAEVDLIVMGRGRHSADEVLLGTTSQKVFFASNRPVVFVPQKFG